MSSHCPECGFEELEPRKRVEDNEVVEDGLYCPDCEMKFDEEPTVWEDLDFPVWVEYESYDDDFGLWRAFWRQTGVWHGTEPDHVTEGGSDFKYAVFTVWFKVTEDGSVEGPYDGKRGELLDE